MAHARTNQVLATAVLALVLMPTPISTSVYGATDDESAMVEWALSRFGAAGLQLPPLIVSFHDDGEGCGGFVGLYDEGHVQVCNRFGLERTQPRNTLLHELAHAWTLANLTTDTIRAFLAHRDLETWTSADVAWWQQGMEQAAEIVAWGLMDDDPYRSIWLHTEECSELVSAFRLLTGIDPLHPATTFCK